MDGGTFTISNGGVFGSMMGTPIINPPQSAILGMHAIIDRPVAIKGKVRTWSKFLSFLRYFKHVLLLNWKMKSANDQGGHPCANPIWVQYSCKLLCVRVALCPLEPVRRCYTELNPVQLVSQRYCETSCAKHCPMKHTLRPLKSFFL